MQSTKHDDAYTAYGLTIFPYKLKAICIVNSYLGAMFKYICMCNYTCISEPTVVQKLKIFKEINVGFYFH